MPETPTEVRKRLTEVRQQSVELLQQRKFEEAIDLWEQACTGWPHIRLLLEIARIRDQSGDLEGARDDYATWHGIAGDRHPDGPAVLQRHDELVAQLAARVDVTVESVPTGAQVFISPDSTTPVGATPWTGRLDPGAREILVRLSGHGEARRPLELVTGQPARVSVTLAPLSPPSGAPEGHAPGPDPADALGSAAEPPPSSDGAPVLGWTLVGLGAASLVTGGVFWSMANEAAAGANDVERGTAPRRDDAANARDYERIAALAAGAGVVVAGLGGYFLLFDGDPPRVSLTWGPGGVSASGQF